MQLNQTFLNRMTEGHFYTDADATFAVNIQSSPELRVPAAVGKSCCNSGSLTQIHAKIPAFIEN